MQNFEAFEEMLDDLYGKGRLSNYLVIESYRQYLKALIQADKDNDNLTMEQYFEFTY